MDKLSNLERAELDAIALQMPERTDGLMLQLREARVTGRENTGAGFYTTLDVPPSAGTVEVKSPIGNVGTALVGLKHGIGLMLWLTDGRMHKLEGYSFGESTSDINFEQVDFGLVCPRVSPQKQPLLIKEAPELAADLEALLVREGEIILAAQVQNLAIFHRSDHRHSTDFYTAPRPNGPWGPNHRTLALRLGALHVDAVCNKIVMVEVHNRDPRNSDIHVWHVSK